jgi:hypothetical protein
MTTFVSIKLFSDRHPARGPNIAAVVYVKITASVIDRNVVVTIARQSSQACVPIKTVSSRGIGNKTKKILGAQVVDPGIRSLGSINNVFSFVVVEISKFHNNASPLEWVQTIHHIRPENKETSSACQQAECPDPISRYPD